MVYISNVSYISNIFVYICNISERKTYAVFYNTIFILITLYGLDWWTIHWFVIT